MSVARGVEGKRTFHGDYPERKGLGLQMTGADADRFLSERRTKSCLDLLAERQPEQLTMGWDV